MKKIGQNRRRWRVCGILFAVITMLVVATVVHAGYRNVDSASEIDDDARTRTPRFRARMPSTDMLDVTIVRTNGLARHPRNNDGATDEMILEPGEEVIVGLSGERLHAGTSIFAYTVHGGRINGQISTMLPIDDARGVLFTFKMGKYYGNYPIILRYGGREEQINLWVDEGGCCR